MLLLLPWQLSIICKFCLVNLHLLKWRSYYLCYCYFPVGCVKSYVTFVWKTWISWKKDLITPLLSAHNEDIWFTNQKFIFTESMQFDAKYYPISLHELLHQLLSSAYVSPLWQMQLCKKEAFVSSLTYMQERAIQKFIWPVKQKWCTIM